LVNVITNSVVPPALMLLGVNDLASVGRLGVIVSMSAAVQVPDAQPMPVPVFVTPAGTEIAAVLVTCVCANAGSCNAIRKKNAHKPPTRKLADRNLSNDVNRRLSTFLLQFSKNEPVI
jgi:hypothetical protein